MSDDWDFYFTRVNSAVSSIFVDLGIRADIPDVQRPHLLWVWVPMLAGREDGLSSDEESPTLHAIEDALSLALAERNGALLVGRITGSNRREYYFYGRNAEGFVEALASVFVNFSGYSPEFGEQPDAVWRQYLDVLYPSIRERTQINNARVIRALANAGDTPGMPRPIIHWINYRYPESGGAISRALVSQGFSISRVETVTSDSEYPFTVTAVRDDRTEQDAVDNAAFQILDAIAGYEASYDGWEAQVMRSH